MEELFEAPGQRPPGYSLDRGSEGFRYAVGQLEADVLLAVEDDSIVGLASVYVDFPSIRFGRRCWLEDLVVTSGRRGQGIGKALLDAATQWARERGCSHLELNSGLGREDAHRFYLREAMAPSWSFGRQIE